MTGWRLYLAVVVIGVLVGAGLAWLTEPGAGGGSGAPVAAGDELAVGETHPGFRHRDLGGDWVTAADFAGQALLVNFWATWCAPCRREMPALQSVSRKRGDSVAVVGIAMDDAEAVRAFVEELGIDYTILVGYDDVLDTQRAWGNAAGALPYTVLVDADGVVRWRHYGEVTAEELEEALAGLPSRG
jgi:peroxiredoxin